MRYVGTIISTAICALCLIPACASDVANRYYGSEKFPARDIESVEVLAKPPEKAYSVIADFQSRGETQDDMRRKAAAIGADAVIVVFLGGGYDRSNSWTADKSQQSGYTRITATAIRYK